jgi:glycosyltransferase involved in cell wall biosynthesis
MPKLSVVIITFNEDRNIRRCLESLINIADDIVVVDSFSTDKTAEICKEFGVNFISHKWEGYSGSKNFGNSNAMFDWILSLDADESLSEELKSSIIKAKEKQKTEFYSINRLTNYCGKWIKHSGWYPDNKLRIFDRTKAKWTGLIHETIDYDKNIKINFLKGDLYHYSYYTIYEHLDRLNKFSDIASKEMHEQGKRCSVLKLIFKTKFKFLQIYFLKLGFLDGFYGLVISLFSTFYVFIKLSKLRELNKS